MYPLTKLETPYNKESIDKIVNSFWQKDVMTILIINKNLYKEQQRVSCSLLSATATLFCNKVLFLVSVLNF